MAANTAAWLSPAFLTAYSAHMCWPLMISLMASTKSSSSSIMAWMLNTSAMSSPASASAFSYRAVCWSMALARASSKRASSAAVSATWAVEITVSFFLVNFQLADGNAVQDAFTGSYLHRSLSFVENLVRKKPPQGLPQGLLSADSKIRRSRSGTSEWPRQRRPRRRPPPSRSRCRPA